MNPIMDDGCFGHGCHLAIKHGWLENRGLYTYMGKECQTGILYEWTMNLKMSYRLLFFITRWLRLHVHEIRMYTIYSDLSYTVHSGISHRIPVQKMKIPLPTAHEPRRPCSRSLSKPHRPCCGLVVTRSHLGWSHGYLAGSHRSTWLVYGFREILDPY